MGAGFWLRRFALALAVAAPLLFVAQWLKGRTPLDAVWFTAGWGLVSAALFSGIGHWRWRRKPACMLPRQEKEPGEAGS